MFALKFASYAHLILKMSKTSRNLRAFSWGKFSWTEMICVKKIDIMQLWLLYGLEISIYMD